MRGIPANHPKKDPVLLSKNRVINLATTYSRGTYRPTTIGCSGLNGRVRDGNGWAPGKWSPGSVYSPKGEIKKFRDTANKGGKINAFEQLELH